MKGLLVPIHMQWRTRLPWKLSREQSKWPRDVRHTDGAVLAVPARAAFALAVPAGPVFCTAWVAGPLVARSPHPTVLTAAGASYTDAMATTVSSTDLCGQERRAKGEERENKGLLSQLLLGTRVTLGHLDRLCER